MQNQNYSNYPNETGDLFTEQVLYYGGFWERFAAAFIDVLIVTIPNFAIKFVLGNSGESYLITLVIDWLYYSLQESGSNQATIGKKAMGLVVTSTTGDRISFGQATGRYFGKIISAFILLIGYLMMIWDSKKQTLHDKMANTLVIKVNGSN